MRRRSPPSSLVRALRAVAAVVSLVLVGAQLASIGHHVLVAHYLCASHGTLHHGAAPEAGSTEREREAALPAEAEDHGSHDECSFPARTPAEMLLASGAELAAVGAGPESVLDSTPALRAHASIPLLALAPKLSPPSV